jgi:hypothetical protein
MGIALGQMGMDIQTFYRLSPEEFEIVYTEWSKLRNGEFENTWEQTRAIAFWSTVANLKNKSIKKFMPLPWDNEKKKRVASSQAPRNDGGKREKAHDPERFERLKAKYGGTI